MENIVTNVCAKFNFDRSHIDKALGNFPKSNNNKHKNNVYSAWGSVSGPNFFWIAIVAYWTRCVSEYNSNSTQSEIGQTCRYFVKKYHKNTNQQALLQRLRAAYVCGL